MITIADYGVGNLASIQNILKKIGVASKISSDEKDILAATKLILPGVGAFDSCVQQLRSSGLMKALERQVLERKIPILGICVGMQLMLSESEEGEEKGLGWIKGDVRKFDIKRLGTGHKIPHMGWSEVHEKKQTQLLEGMHDVPRFYFVHSYHVLVDDASEELLTSNYGYSFTAAIQRENIFGVQFHPEKSHRFGMKLLENFAATSL